MKMKRSRKLVYNGDTTLNEDIDFQGSLEVFGNLIVPSIKLRGNLDVTETVQVTKSIEIVGSVTIHSDLEVTDNLVIKGPCLIRGNTHAGSILIDGEVDTGSLNAKNIILSGSVLIKNNLMASESILITISDKKPYVIGGTIEAPTITLRYRSFYTKWLMLPGKIFGLFNMKPRFERKIVIKNISVKTDHLILKSVYNEDECTFIFDDDCQIDAKVIEQVQHQI